MPSSRPRDKKTVDPEIERLRALLIQVIKRPAKYEPEALELLDQLHPDDPDDGLGDL
jgi:hypothetical protein